MPNYQTIPIDEITVDEEFQVRFSMHEKDIAEYTQRIKDGTHFPPIHCGRLKDGDETLYLVDGFHRLQAYKNAGVDHVDVEIMEYDERREMFAYGFRVNNSHGIKYTDPEEESGLDQVIKLFPEKSIRQLVDLTGSSRWKVSQRINQLSGAGQLKRPEKTIGKDGRERPATVPRPAPQTAAIPHEYCAGGCGTPIWDDIKEAKDCAYVQWDGKWFCSEECAQAYLAKQPEPQEPPDEDDDEYEDDEDDDPPPTCEICGISTVEPEKSGWIRTPDGRWCCSEECLNGFRKGWEQVECPRCGQKVRRMYLEKFRWVHDKEGTWFCSKECRDVWPSLLKEPDLYPRAKAHLQSRAGGQKPEQETEPEEPDEFTFTDVDEETLPVCTEEKPEATKCRLRVIYDVESEITDPAEVLRQLGLHSPFTFTSSYIPSIRITLAGLYENINQSLNNNININPATFTEFFICCKGKKGPVKVFISRKKYDEWKKNFGPAFDIDANLDECCKYYNELTGSEMLSAGGVYSKVYAWLLKNWKAQKKEESKPKKNAYKDAGLRFDPSIY